MVLSFTVFVWISKKLGGTSMWGTKTDRTDNQCITKHVNRAVLDVDKKKQSPGGVPQQKLRSSICSTSKPMNHAPRETSSFAYLCNICLSDMKTLIMINPNYLKSNTQVWFPKSILVNRYIGCKILWNHIQLPCCMPKILVSILSKFPILWFMILGSSAKVRRRSGKYIHEKTLVHDHISNEHLGKYSQPSNIPLRKNGAWLHTSYVYTRLWHIPC